MSAWIASSEFAVLAHIERQVANRLLREFNEGRSRPWQSGCLVVREVRGRGGRSGVSYQVKASSLPQALQEQLKSSKTPLQLSLPLPSASPGGTEGGWWHFHLAHLLLTEKGSVERGAAVKSMVGKTVLDWKNRPLKLARSTILNKLKQLEDTGSAGTLRRRERSDTGKAKVLISRPWDQAVPFDLATRQKIAENTLQELRGCIKDGGTLSRARQHVKAFLKDQTIAYGFRPDARELERICTIPARLYYREAPVFKRVYRHKHDRKASSDAMPHISRVMPDGPGKLYVLDVHHINVLVKQGDKVGTVKMLGCLDMGTRRFTAEFVFFELRGGVRNIDNIELLRRVFADPAWGVPGLVYVDNGKEYRFVKHLDNALKLAAEEGGSTDERQSRIIHSLPYNAQSKPIENVHHQLNNHEFRHCQGFIDDDRFDPMRPELGKLPKPFGGFSAFVEYARGLIDAYNWTPQPHGQLRGDSPNSRFGQHVAKGWGALVMDPARFDSVFCDLETRLVRNQSIKVAGRHWSCPALDEFLDQKVVARVPAYHGFNELRLEKFDGTFIGIATPDRQFEFDDPRGALTSAERKKATRQAIAAADRSAPDVDMGASRQAFARAQLPIHPNPPAGAIAVTMDGPTGRSIVPTPGRRKSRAENDAGTRNQMVALQAILDAKKAMQK